MPAKDFFKKEGYIVVRPHEIEHASFIWNESKSVDIQRIEVLEYAHERVIDETKKFCESNGWPLPTWALPREFAVTSDKLNQRLAEVGERARSESQAVKNQSLDNKDKRNKNVLASSNDDAVGSDIVAEGGSGDKNTGAKKGRRF